MNNVALIPAGTMFFLSPLLVGIINKTKAFFAGRQGVPLLQAYYDIYKLLHKGAVYSRTTTWVFRAGPAVGLGVLFLAALIVPCGSTGSVISFPGDIILLAYLLGLARFFMALAALDTGSSFEGMGASREMHFSVLAEPAFILGIAALMRQTGELSLGGIYGSLSPHLWLSAGPVLIFVCAALMLVLLAENCRVPVDDPNTHLELTMIHEVMVLDHSGPDLAFILYSQCLKLWVFGTLVAGLVVPAASGNAVLCFCVFAGSMAMVSVITGVVESIMARFRLIKIPLLLIGALSLSILALLFQVR